MRALLVLMTLLGGCHEDGSSPANVAKTIGAAQAEIYTVRHDGHTFVVARAMQAVSIIHHPSCECLK